MEQVSEKKLMKKITFRLLPVIMGLYVLAYIDRVNVGFAALTMNKDIGIDAYTYGVGAGIFFLGYFIFEIPSNIMLAKVGAKKWIARIFFTWGIISSGMVFVQGANSFYIMRFLLGAAEAGFFPGIILYLTFWFPASYRARIIAEFMIAIPIALAVGAPVSMWIMQLDGALGVKGWQWLFICEGVPSILAPLAIWKFLPNNPNEVSWLTDAEKGWLVNALVSDREKVGNARTDSTVGMALANPIVWMFGLMFMATTAANIGLAMFIPQIIKEVGFSSMQTGFITSIPYIIGCAGMVAIGYSSDRTKERKWHIIGSLLIAAIGLGTAGYFGGSIVSIAALAIATIGFLGAKSPLLSLAAGKMAGLGAATGIAIINSVANLGGFVGPWAIGLSKKVTTNFSGGLYGLAMIAFLGAVLTLIVVRIRTKGPEKVGDNFEPVTAVKP